MVLTNTRSHIERSSHWPHDVSLKHDEVGLRPGSGEGSYRPLANDARVQLQARACGICGGPTGTVTWLFFSKSFGLPLSSFYKYVLLICQEEVHKPSNGQHR